MTTESVLVDLDVPLAIMREKLRRERGVELNARNGDGFVFVVRISTQNHKTYDGRNLVGRGLR